MWKYVYARAEMVKTADRALDELTISKDYDFQRLWSRMHNELMYIEWLA